MKNYLLGLLLSVLILPEAQAQSEKTSIAIFPFVASSPEYRNRASHIQQIVMEILRKKSVVELIDRTNDSLLLKELDNQIRGQSVDAKVVQQGKVLGASQMIVGTISNIAVESKTTYDRTTGTNNTKYIANISFALQLSEVETGKILNQRVFTSSQTSGGGGGLGTLLKVLNIDDDNSGDTREDAIANAVKATRRQIAGWINETYPPEISIVNIEERDKKGKPATVVVTGIDGFFGKGSQFTVHEIEVIEVSGKKLKRIKRIAELRVKEIQGDLTVCKVTDGEEILEDKMNAKASLTFQTK